MTGRTDQDWLRDLDSWNRRRREDQSWLPVLAGVDLAGWDLRAADLRRVDLRKADLTGADLRRADLREADLRGATLSGAKLWKSLRDGWQVADVVCDGVCWDQDGEMNLRLYDPGRFADIHANDPTFLILGDNLTVEPEIFLLLANLMAEEGPPIVQLRFPNSFTIQPRPGDRRADRVDEMQGEIRRLRAIEQQGIQDRRKLNSLLVRTHPLVKDGPSAAAGDIGYFTVLKTDIVGYSLLPQGRRDQIEAYLDRFGKGIFEQNGVCWANDAGDALTAAFEDVVEAANAALELVASMGAIGVSMRAALASGKLQWVDRFNQGRLALRGDALIEAARLEPLVEPGQVYAHGEADILGLKKAGFQVNPDTVINKKAFDRVKVDDPISVYRISRFNGLQ